MQQQITEKTEAINRTTMTTESSKTSPRKWFTSAEDGVLKREGVTECHLKDLEFIKQSEFIKELSTGQFGVSFVENQKEGSAEAEGRKIELFAGAKALYKTNMTKIEASGEEMENLFTEEEIDCMVNHENSITIIIRKDKLAGGQVVASATIGIMQNTDSRKSMIIFLVAVTHEMYNTENGVDYKGKGLMRFLMNVAKSLHIELDGEFRKGREDRKLVSELHWYILLPKNGTSLSVYAAGRGFQVWFDPKCMFNEWKEKQLKEYIHLKKCELLSASGKLLFVAVIAI